MRLYFQDKELERAIVTGGAKGDYRAESDARRHARRATRDQVEYEAGRITFEVPKNRIRLEDERAPHVPGPVAALARCGLRLEAARSSRRRGNPVLEDRGDTLRGRALTYDLGARKGAVFDARTRYESGWYTGERIRRLGDSVLDVQRRDVHDVQPAARRTTRSSRDRMKIYLKDKIIARPVVFAVRGIPLLALPFWVFPIRDDRHSGMLVPQIQFGFSSGGERVRAQRRLLLGAERLHGLHVLGRLLPVAAVVAAGAARRATRCCTSSRARSTARTRAASTPATSAGRRLPHAPRAADRREHVAHGRRRTSPRARDYTQDPLHGQPAGRPHRPLPDCRASRSTTAGRGRRSTCTCRGARTSTRIRPRSAPVPKLDEQLPTLSIAFPTRTLGRKAVGGQERVPAVPVDARTTRCSARFVNLRT